MRVLACLAPLTLCAACDRWQGIDTTVSVSADVAALYSSSAPGIVVMEHEEGSFRKAVGALCGDEAEAVELSAHYLLPGCAYPHQARAFTTAMPDDLDCDDDYETYGQNARKLYDLEPEVSSEWFDVYPEHGDDDGCWAAEGTGQLELVLD